MLIILLSGKAGTGKDTAYKLIKKYYSNAKRFAFADELKGIASLLTWDGKKDDKGRRFLQNLGNIAREYNKNVWADIVADKIDSECFSSDIVIITDWRFPNEIEVIKNRFGEDVFSIRIFGRQNDLGENSNDISEHALDDYNFDYYIENSTTKEDFENKLLNLLNTIGV